MLLVLLELRAQDLGVEAHHGIEIADTEDDVVDVLDMDHLSNRLDLSLAYPYRRAMSKPAGRLALATIFLTVILDSAGIGLVLPVLPDLFSAKGQGHAVAFGFFLSLYALMQFLFAPILGALSDRIGRKPVLIASVAGAVLNYTVMALLPPLWILFIARAVAGITGSNMSVASAYLTDISGPEDRAARFGQLSACLGIGFILGPALGGMLRDFGLNWPFAAAAALAAINLAMVLLVLPESRVARDEVEAGAADPLQGLRGIASFRSLTGLLFVVTMMAMIGEIGGSVWSSMSNTAITGTA